MNSKLEFDSIEKSFDENQILSSISISCEVGKIVGLLGRNGSGKSTLMKIVFGTLGASIKSVRIDGIPLLGNYLKKKLIGYLPQGRWLPGEMRVRQALFYFKVDRDILLLPFPEFSDWMELPVRNLSGGYLRILETILILNSHHTFIMLDEPFSGLMPKHIEDMKKLINEAKATKGIIISDHLHRHVLDLAKEVYLLNHGKTYLIASKEDLIFRGYLNE